MPNNPRSSSATSKALCDQEYDTIDDLLIIPKEKLQSVLEVKCNLKSATVEKLLIFLSQREVSSEGASPVSKAPVVGAAAESEIDQLEVANYFQNCLLFNVFFLSINRSTMILNSPT